MSVLSAQNYIYMNFLVASPTLKFERSKNVCIYNVNHCIETKQFCAHYTDQGM